MGGGRDGFYLEEPIQNKLYKPSEFSTTSILKINLSFLLSFYLCGNFVIH